MSSATAAPPAGQGAQRPRILWTPPSAVSSSGQEAIELADMAGLHLDPWEQYSLARCLDERADGNWAASEFGLLVPRQNGKGSVLEARELAALYLFKERLTVHTAHLMDTSIEAFIRLLELIESTPDLDREVAQVHRAHGKEGIQLRNGCRIRFRTRTAGGGRGFSGDLVILDEAMILAEAALGALFPTMAARANSQIIYTASAVDQVIHEHGVVLARVRARALAGGDPGLGYLEWSADEQLIKKRPELAADPKTWAQANPGMGIRISEEHIAREHRSMAAKTFAVERLNIGDWPDVEDHDDQRITLQAWARLADPDSEALDPVCLAIDVTPSRSHAAISAAGRRRDRLHHVETIDHRPGTGWVVDRIVALKAKHKPAKIIVDERSPAASLLPEFARRKIRVTLVNSKEHGQACGVMLDLVRQDALRHLGTPELAEAIAGAKTRTLGDAFAWSRTRSTADISPLVAGTLALWGSHTRKSRKTRAISLAGAIAAEAARKKD